MRVIVSVNKESGNVSKIASTEEGENQDQVLIIQGADSVFMPTGGITTAEGEFIWNGHFSVSKYSNSKDEDELKIDVGHHTITSIKRKLPLLEYEFEYTNNLTGESFIETYESYIQGFKSLSK